MPVVPGAARAAVTHPDPRVRAILAENPNLPPAARAVLAEDPDPGVRRVAVMMAAEYGVELPTELTVRLATGPEARLRHSAIGLPGLPDETLLALAEDLDPASGPPPSAPGAGPGCARRSGPRPRPTPIPGARGGRTRHSRRRTPADDGRGLPRRAGRTPPP
ncbi:hypothetical protein NKH18_20485 [Streptomyces sp. M10(2022)]